MAYVPEQFCELPEQVQNKLMKIEACFISDLRAMIRGKILSILHVHDGHAYVEYREKYYHLKDYKIQMTGTLRYNHPLKEVDRYHDLVLALIDDLIKGSTWEEIAGKKNKHNKAHAA